jgi:hypothetical protein
MPISIRTIVIAGATALAVAAAAVAAPAAKDPGTLILQRKDFPARSDYEAGDELDYTSALKAVGARVAGYYAGTYSEKRGHLQLHGAVITTGDVKTAKQALGLAVKHLQATWKATGVVYKPGGGVPSYGDQQSVFSKQATIMSSTGAIALVVRKRAVVWVLWALLDHVPQPPKMAEVLAGLEAYAAKQKTRVGAG